jgi:hypothetical protein
VKRLVDIPRRKVRFNLMDKTALNDETVKQALQDQRFSDVSVKSAPPR